MASLSLNDLNDAERNALVVDVGLAIREEFRKVGITKKLMTCVVFLDQDVRFVSGWTNFNHHDDAEYAIEAAAKRMCKIAGFKIPPKLEKEDDDDE